MYAQLQFVRRQKPQRGPDPAHLIHAAGPQKSAKQSYCHKYVKQDLTNKLLWCCLILQDIFSEVLRTISKLYIHSAPD